MKTRAAVAIEAGKPLEIMEVDLDGPRAGEVLVEIMATGICHTDEFTLSGADPEGMFPAISWPAPATPMIIDSPQPLCAHSSACRITLTLPIHSNE